MEQTPKKTFSRIGLSLFLILIISTVLQVIAFGVAKVIGYDVGTIATYLLTFIPLYIIAIPIGLLAIKPVPAEKIGENRISFGKWMQFFLICVFVMYLGSAIGVAVMMLFSGDGSALESPLNELIIGTPLWLKLLFIVVLAPCIEEFLFRKVLITRMRRYGEKLAIVVSALCFGLFHGNFSQFFYATLLGLVFGYVYTRTGRLRYSIALHTTINFMGSIIAGAFLEKMDLDAMMNLNPADTKAAMELMTSPAMLGFFAYLMVIAVLWVIGLILFCIRIGKAVFYTAPEEIPKGQRFRTVCGNVGMILFFVACAAVFVMSVL